MYSCERVNESTWESTARFYREWHAALLRYGQSLGLARADAEDIAQEGFLKLFRHLGDGKPTGNLRGWLFRVFYRDALKKAARQTLPLQAEEADYQVNPEERGLAKERRARILRVINALNEQDRACLLLRAQGLQYREIALRLDMSLGSVANSLARSLSKLESGRRK
jgi:RNA polymerase sigma-70 factor, ECF subfamily